MVLEEITGQDSAMFDEEEDNALELGEFISGSIRELYPTVPSATQDELGVVFNQIQELYSALYPTVTLTEILRLFTRSMFPLDGHESDDGDHGEGSYNYARDSGLSEEMISGNLKSRTCREGDDGLREICVVCQCEYQVEETVGGLECGHEYHANCIKTWLMKNNSCSVCKREAIPSSS